LSKILTHSLHNGENLKGLHGITDIVIEEASDIYLDDYSQLDAILRSNEPHQQIFVLFNPTLKSNWTYKHFFERGTPANTIIHFTTYKDNIFNPPSTITFLESLKNTNPNRYRQWTIGEFGNTEGLVYTNWEQQEFNSKDIKGKPIYGLDFGYRDKMALIAAKVDEDNKIIYVYDEYYQSYKINPEIADVIKYKGYTKEVIIADAARPDSIEEIRRLGIPRIKPAHKPHEGVLYGIQRICQYKIIVHPSCQATITELENYSWVYDEKTNEYTDKPIDDFDHLMDALRYAIQTIEQNNRLQVIKNFRF
jgi:phage terminase large subunit